MFALRLDGGGDLLRGRRSAPRGTAPGAPGDQVLAEGLVEGAAQPSAAALGLGHDEVEVGVPDRLEVVGQREADDAVAGAVRGEQDRRVPPGGLLARASGRCSRASPARSGKAAFEQRLDLGEAAPVVLAGATPRTWLIRNMGPSPGTGQSLTIVIPDSRSTAGP